MKCPRELAVGTLAGSRSDHLCVPNVTLFVLRFRKHHIVEGIASDDLPPHRLFERTAQKFYDLLDGLVADIGRCRLARLCGNGSGLL